MLKDFATWPLTGGTTLYSVQTYFKKATKSFDFQKSNFHFILVASNNNNNILILVDF